MLKEKSEQDEMEARSNGSVNDELPASIDLRDLAFTYLVTPYVLVENPLNAEKLTSLMNDSDDEMTVDNLSESSEEEYELY
jgi:hypothetical protein